jgi:hypothetical protein
MQSTKDFEAEKKRVLEYLKENTATASQVSIALDIWRPNMCRHKKQLQDAGLLVELYKDKCPVTHFKAAYLTCNDWLVRQHKEKLPQLALAI